MKKRISLLAAVIFVFVFGTTAFAADYYVDEADMHISLPSHYDVIKPGMDKDIYNSMGYNDSYESIMSYLEENGFILYGNSWDGNSSVLGSFLEDYGINYASCTEAKLNEEKTLWLSALVSDGTYTALEEEIISVGPNKFIRFLFEDSDGNCNIMYITTHDRDLLFIEYFADAEAYNDEFIAMAADSVESIVFGDVADAKELPATEHYVPEIDAYISAPDKYHIMTSEGYDDWFSENYTEEEFRELKKSIAEDRRYFVAASGDFAYDFSLIVDDLGYSLSSEEECFAMLKEEYSKMDVDILKDEIIEIGGANFYRMRYKNNENLTNGYVYFGIKEEKLYAYSLVVYYGELTERLENELYSIVESTRYEAPGETAPEPVPEKTEPTVIADELLGFSMTVPENWVMDESLSQPEGDFHKYAFYSKEDPSAIIACTAMSVKAFASDMTFGFVELTEEDFENMTEKDYAGYLEVPEEAVTTKKIGEYTYYFAEKEIAEAPAFMAIMIKDGVYYTYAYTNLDKELIHPVLEEFLANVEYTVPTIGSEGTEPTETAKLAKTVGTVLIVFIVLGIAVIGIIIAVIIIAVKKSKKKKQEAAFAAVPTQPMIQSQQEEISAPAGNSIAPEEEAAAPEEEIPEPAGNNFCASCGAKLKEDSRFCTKCGTPINKE